MRNKLVIYLLLIVVRCGMAYSPFCIGRYQCPYDGSTVEYMGGIGIADQYIYVGLLQTGSGLAGKCLKIMRIDKDTLTIIDSMPRLVNISKIAIGDKFAFFHRPDVSRLYLLDISIPDKPSIVDSLTFDLTIAEYPYKDTINDMKISGSHLLICSQAKGLITMDFSNPSDMAFLDTLKLLNTTFSGMSISGNFAYIIKVPPGGSNYGKIGIIDFSNPADLKLVSTIAGTEYCSTPPVILGNMLYSIAYNYDPYRPDPDFGKFYSYDISNPSNPSRISMNTIGAATGIAGYNNKLCLANFGYYFNVLSTSNLLTTLFQYPQYPIIPATSNWPTILGTIDDSIACFLQPGGMGFGCINLNGAYQGSATSTQPLDYLIIYPEAWIDAVSPYVDFKNQKGIKTEMIAVEKIPGYTGTTADTLKIKEYIYTAYFDRGLKYVLLVGDVDKLPSFKGASGYGDYNRQPYGSDFTYFDPFIGNLGTNLAEKYWTPHANTREIIGARLPVDLKSQAVHYLKLWMDYSGKIETPFQVTFVADSSWDIKSRTYSRTWLNDSWNNVPDAIVDSFFPSAQLTKKDIYDVFSNSPLFVNYLGHGNDWRWTAPNFVLDDVLNINNHGKPCFMVTQACRFADIDKADCMLERFFEAESTSFLGIIAATNSPMNYDWNVSYTPYEPYFWKQCADQYNATGRVFPCSLFCNFGADFDNWGYFGDPTIVLNKNLDEGVKTTVDTNLSDMALTCSPNPFNPGTKISFTLLKTTVVKMSMFDINGRIVRNMISGTLKHGVHTIFFDGKDGQDKALGSGVYLVRLATPGKVINYRAALVR